MGETGDSYLSEFVEILNMLSESHNVAAIERFRRFHMEFSQEACMDVMEEHKSDDNHEAQIQEFLQIKGIALVVILKSEYIYTRKELVIWLSRIYWCYYGTTQVYSMVKIDIICITTVSRRSARFLSLTLRCSIRVL
ncbi:hypothetical protein [Pelosinus propionicus]|nr:hypothetical protein [Pelosinus propionicus]